MEQNRATYTPLDYIREPDFYPKHFFAASETGRGPAYHIIDETETHGLAFAPKGAEKGMKFCVFERVQDGYRFQPGRAVVLFISSKQNRRPGEEHGSARWGDPRQLDRKYRDKDPKRNAILTQHLRMSLNSRQHFRNLLQIVVGGSGAGKTRYIVKLSLNPYIEPEYIKWLKERRDIQKANGKYRAVWNRQSGKCAFCNQAMLVDQEVDVVEKNIGRGRNVRNLMYIHRQCAYDTFTKIDDTNDPLDLASIVEDFINDAPAYRSPYLELTEYFRTTNKTPFSLTFRQIESITFCQTRKQQVS